MIQAYLFRVINYVFNIAVGFNDKFFHVPTYNTSHNLELTHLSKLFFYMHLFIHIVPFIHSGLFYFFQNIKIIVDNLFSNIWHSVPALHTLHILSS